MKNMKYTVTFVIALACVVLFASCNNVFDKPGVQHPAANGYGRISINIKDGQAARTVMPPMPVFDKYVYTFTKTGETAGIEKEPESDGYFSLEVGEYTVEVQGYFDDGDGESFTLAASGVSALFDVGPGLNDPVDVPLFWVDTGTGTFSYTITYPANASAAIILLQTWPDLDDVTLDPGDILNGITETLPLPSGSYLLTVVVSKDGWFAGINESIHINPPLPTVYTKNFNDGDFLAAIPISVDFDTPPAYTYDGNAFTPAVTVTDDDTGDELDADVHYTVTYTNNTNAGPATVIIRGVDDYAGSYVTTTFIIAKAPGEAVDAPTLNDAGYNRITVNPVAAAPNGQTAEYARNTVDTAPSSGWQTSPTFTGLSDVTTYYIFARAAENVNYEAGAPSVSLAVTTLQSVAKSRFEFYWVDQHGSLVTTSGGKLTLFPDEHVTITAQDAGYDARQWRLNSRDTGQSGPAYDFSSSTPGKHTVSLLVEKDGKLYNTNITIIVSLTRAVTIDMYDRNGDGWDGSGALRIEVNGTQIATGVKVSGTAANNTPSGQRYTNTFTFDVEKDDVVDVYWIAGTAQTENSFIVYYADTPPDPAFYTGPFTGTNVVGPTEWSGSNALIYRIRGNAPEGLNNVVGGALLGSFTVQ